MNLAQYLVSSAIKYSMTKNCFANIVLAGPICSGKKSIAELVSEFIDITNYQKTVSIFTQEDYYKPYTLNEDNEFGVKNIDSKSAYDVKRYVSDVRKFFEAGHVCSAIYLQKTSNNLNEGDKVRPSMIFSMKQKKRINIFVGPHVIDLLKDSEIDIPEAIYIYLDVDLNECIKRRLNAGIMVPTLPFGSTKWEEYRNLIINQNEEEILPQKEKAQFIINLK